MTNVDKLREVLKDINTRVSAVRKTIRDLHLEDGDTILIALDEVLDDYYEAHDVLDDLDNELRKVAVRKDTYLEVFGEYPDEVRIRDWVNTLQHKYGPTTPVQGLLELLATSNT